MNKQYVWQKTEKCARCAFNDDPGACHWYGYRFWEDLPMADDCWDFITPEQWTVLQDLYEKAERHRLKRKAVHEKFREFCHENHPGVPAGYVPPYYPKNDPFAKDGDKDPDLYSW